MPEKFRILLAVSLGFLLGIVFLVAVQIYIILDPDRAYLTDNTGPVLLVVNSREASNIVEETQPILRDELRQARADKLLFQKRSTEPFLHYSLSPAGFDPDVAAALPNRVKMLHDLEALPVRLVPSRSYCAVLRHTNAPCGKSITDTSELLLIRITSGREKGLEAWACSEQIYGATAWL